MGSQDRKIINHVKDNTDFIVNLNGLSHTQDIRDIPSRVEVETKVSNSDDFENSTVEVF